MRPAVTMLGVVEGWAQDDSMSARLCLSPACQHGDQAGLQRSAPCCQTVAHSSPEPGQTRADGSPMLLKSLHSCGQRWTARGCAHTQCACGPPILWSCSSVVDPSCAHDSARVPSASTPASSLAPWPHQHAVHS